jgi:hypothetical protein
MPNKPKPKRNHHVLPELYLKGFVIKTDEPFIWVYKRGGLHNPGRGKITNNPYRDSIKKVTTRDYYAFPHEDGKKDFESYENFLEKVEKPANNIFAKLRSKQLPSADEKDVFSRYLVQMHRRVPSYRKMLKQIADKIVAKYELSKSDLAKLDLPDTEDTRRKIRAIATGISEKKGFETRLHLKVISLVENSLLPNVLSKMAWRFFIAPPGHSFLTGDNPLFICKWGLNKPDAEFSIPLSSDICLAATALGFPESFLPAKAPIIKELNRRTASNSAEFLYFCRDQSWVITLFNKDNHECNRLQ